MSVIMLHCRGVGYDFIRPNDLGSMMTDRDRRLTEQPWNLPNESNRKKGQDCAPSRHLSAIVALLVAFACLFFSTPLLAEKRVFEKEYTYQAGDDDSKNSSRAAALREVKRLLLEELGTYLQSRTEVKDFRLTQDEVTTLTAGIVSTEIITERWDGRLYYLKAKIAADPDDVARSVDRLRKDGEKTRELEEMRKSLQALVAENEKLKQEMSAAKDDRKRVTLAAYQKNVGALDAMEWFERGYRNELWGDYPEAIKGYDKAIELNPEYAAAYNNRGKCYARLGDNTRAVKDFDSAVALNPGLATAHYNRGNAYNRLGNHSQAIFDLGRAIALDPKFAAAYNNRGNVFYRLGDYRQALSDFSRAIALDRGYAPAYYNRGNTYDRLGNRQQAIADLSRAARMGHQGAAGALRSRGIAF